MNADAQTIAVMMPKIARKTLGLRDGSFSHLAVEANAFVFRGEGVTQPVRFPVSLAGTYHSDILNNLFLYLSNNRQNGILCVSTGPLTKNIFFKDGQIVFAGSTDARERIGDVLLRLGYVTREQVASVEAHSDPRRFGVRLRDAGFITQEQLWEALRAQVSGICCSLVSFPVGTFFFLPNAVPADAFSHFVIDPSEVLFRSMVRMDEHHHRVGYDPTKVGEQTPLEVLADMERD